MSTSLRESARTMLNSSRFFGPIRFVYQGLFDRKRRQERLQMQRFFSQFISRGDLVFDVGANRGTFVEAFLSLGASVVAVDANPACCELIKPLSRSGHVKILNVAVSDARGSATFHICEGLGLSTLSDDWKRSAQSSPLHCDTKWLDSIEIELTTLDHLAATYGIPSFVKIDVEGFDDKVIAGMSFHPKALSFEFNRIAPEVSERCLEALKESYVFNFSREQESQLVSAEWKTANQMRRSIDDLAKGVEYGDVIAVRK